MIVNRVDLETGKAAGLSKSKLRLSKWAEGYEQAQGRIRCEERVTNNARRSRGERVQDRVSLPTGRYRRDRMHPDREPRKTIPAAAALAEQRKVAWQRAEERMYREQWQQQRWRERPVYGREWAGLYARQGQQREELAENWRGLRGRFQMWREAGGWRELGGHLRGSPEVLRRWREDLERHHRRERVQLAKAHFEKVGEIERRAGEHYRKHLEGGEKRAEKAVDEKWRHWAYYDHERPPQEYVEAAGGIRCERPGVRRSTRGRWRRRRRASAGPPSGWRRRRRGRRSRRGGRKPRGRRRGRSGGSVNGAIAAETADPADNGAGVRRKDTNRGRGGSGAHGRVGGTGLGGGEDGRMVYYDPPVDWYALRHSVMQERMAQVREIEGESRLPEDEAGRGEDKPAAAALVEAVAR